MCDQNKNKRIDYREFIAATVRKQLFDSENSREQNFNLLVQSFNVFDQDSNGQIQKEEIIEFLKKTNNDISESCAEHIIKEVDHNGDGMICFKEFVAMMQNKFNTDIQASQYLNE